jgi:hypothetical protein
MSRKSLPGLHFKVVEFDHFKIWIVHLLHLRIIQIPFYLASFKNPLAYL